MKVLCQDEKLGKVGARFGFGCRVATQQGAQGACENPVRIREVWCCAKGKATRLRALVDTGRHLA